MGLGCSGTEKDLLSPVHPQDSQRRRHLKDWQKLVHPQDCRRRLHLKDWQSLVDPQDCQRRRHLKSGLEGDSRSAWACQRLCKELREAASADLIQDYGYEQE